MKHLFVFVSAVLILAATATNSPVLVALSFAVVFIGAGVSVYRIAQKAGSSKGRRNFFLASYAVALAILITGIAIMLYASGEEAELLAILIIVIALGWAAALTGGLVACAIARAARKKRETREMADPPKS